MKPIVIYYSRSGNTQKIAEKIQSDMNCDIVKVEPEETYGMSGINWTMKTLKRICSEAEIKLPFDSGLLKKGSYEKWINEVKKLAI